MGKKSIFQLERVNFRLMECRHNIWSMCHTVYGSVKINGEYYSFENALGYWEGDFGRSFPEKYVWTQCFFENGSVMFSVAEVPMMGFSFSGYPLKAPNRGKMVRTIHESVACKAFYRFRIAGKTTFFS